MSFDKEGSPLNFGGNPDLNPELGSGLLAEDALCECWCSRCFSFVLLKLTNVQSVTMTHTDLRCDVEDDLLFKRTIGASVLNFLRLKLLIMMLLMILTCLYELLLALTFQYSVICLLVVAE